MFNLTLRNLGFLVIFFIIGCSSNNKNSSREIVEEEVSSLISDTNMSAVSVAFITKDSMDTFHYGVFSDGSRPSDNTLYDIGSITKTHVGLILAKSVADGLIELDAPVAPLLKNVNKNALKYKGVSITIRNLATHTSGLPTDIFCDELDIAPEARLECFLSHDDKDLIKRLNKYKLQSLPGEKYHYSNAGVRLIGIILENLYKKSLEQLLENVVFSKSGQVETLIELSKEERSRWRKGEHENGVPAPDASAYFNAAGGLKSSAPDMGRYLSYYIQGKDKVAKNALTLLAGDNEGLGRAYIWNTFQLNSEGQYYHGGGTFGTSAWVSIYPREKLAIFLVTPIASPTAQNELNETANRIIARFRRLE